MYLTTFGARVLTAAQPYADQLGDLHGPRHRAKPGDGARDGGSR